MNASAGLIIRRAGQGPARPDREPQGDGSRPGAGRPNLSYLTPSWLENDTYGTIRRAALVRARPGRPRIAGAEE